MLTGTGSRFRKTQGRVSWLGCGILLLKRYDLVIHSLSTPEGFRGSHSRSSTARTDGELEARKGHLTPSRSQRTFNVKMTSCPTVQLSR